MKNKHTICRLLSSAVAIFLITHAAATAADKVVVIPLESSSGDSGAVTTVTSGGGLVWMDRNLGALGVATKSDDAKAYGSLYQWGRLGDGHEYRESPTTTIRSLDDVPGHGNFIVTFSAPWDWKTQQKDGLWQGASGINNPCPAGFRLPTDTEWEIERYFWGSNNTTGAFMSPLKLVVAGYHPSWYGSVLQAGSVGYYWSSTACSGSSCFLIFASDNAMLSKYDRAGGMSVRCIKD